MAVSNRDAQAIEQTLAYTNPTLPHPILHFSKTLMVSSDAIDSAEPTRPPTSPKKVRSSAVLVGRTIRLQSMSSTCKPSAASSSLSGSTACLVQYRDDWNNKQSPPPTTTAATVATKRAVFFVLQGNQFVPTQLF